MTSASLRFPSDRTEAEEVWQHWDWLNGRYYVVADVIVDEHVLLRDAVFDRDTGIAVEVGNERLYDRADLFGRRISGVLVVRQYGSEVSATEAERQAFARQAT
jgi:hypothetical protein